MRKIVIYVLIYIIIEVVFTFCVVFLRPKNSQSYLKPTLGPCEVDDCLGYRKEECYEKVIDELGEFDKCRFKCYGILLEMGNDCNYSRIRI